MTSAEASDVDPRVGAARRWASALHLLLAVLIVVGVAVQVYLIGAYVFGAGKGALDAHKGVGFALHTGEVLLLIAALAAWLPRPDLWLSLALAVVGTAQIALASADRWAGGLHPLFALVVLALAFVLAQHGVRRVRDSPRFALRA